MQLPLTRLARRLTAQPPRRIAAVFATLALVVIGASILVGATAAANGGKRSAPRLTLTRRDPVTVGGRGFQPRVRVAIRLVVGRTFSRHAVANRAGAFTVAFPAVIDRCSSWSVAASQPHHAVVVLRGPKPMCPPA